MTSAFTELGFEPTSLKVPSYDGIDYDEKVNSEVLWRVQHEQAEKFGYSHLKSQWPNWDKEMFTISEYKFAMYDYCKEKNLFKKPVRISQEHLEDFQKRYDDWVDAVALLNDDTIYAYAFLRFNGKPIKLYPYQDCIANDTHRWIDVELSNQIGKSFVLQVLSAVKFHRDHNKQVHIGLVSKSKEQNGQNMRAVKGLLDSASVGYDDSDATTSMSVTTRKVGDKGYNNNIICTVATTSALGYPFDKIYADEFEFWANPEGIAYMYDQIFKPRTFDTKGQIVIFSNPNGKNFVSQDLQKRIITRQQAKVMFNMNEEETQKMFGNRTEIKQFHVYNFNFLDKPGNTIEEWEMEKTATHPFIFASTMAAQRTESRGAALTAKQIEDSYDSLLDDMKDQAGVGKECYFFIDVGHVHDQSMIIGMYLDKPRSLYTEEQLADIAKGALDPMENGVNKVHKIFYQHFYPQTYPLWRTIGINQDLLEGNAISPNDGWEDEAKNQPTLVEVAKKFSLNGVPPIIGGDTTKDETLGTLCSLAGISLVDTVFSGKWKAHWYGRFCTLMAQRRIKRGNVDNWIGATNKSWSGQANTLQIKTKKNDGTAMNYPTYHHTSEEDLDDAIDATVGCLSLCDEESVAPVIGVIVSGDTDKDEKDLNDNESEDVHEDEYELVDNFGIPSFNY